jgi:hypothetical protein
MDLVRIAKNIDKVIKELPSYASEILAREYKKELIDIQQDQLLEGVRGDGKRTQKYKSANYVKQNNKQSAKSYPNRNYFKDGDFFDGMDLAANNDSVMFFSMDSKTRFLEPMEDGELLGVAPQNTDKVDNLKGFAGKLIKKTGYELGR